jgi:hypothetical protein
MVTKSPEDEQSSWKAELAPAIQISCESHYGQEPKLPTFPWYLDQASTPEVREVLSRITFATKHIVQAFSREMAAHLDKLAQQIQEKVRFKYCNQLDIVSITRKVQEMKNPVQGDSRLTVRISKGPRRTLGVHSRSSETAGPGAGATVGLRLDQLSVQVEGEEQTSEVFSTPPKELLSDLTLERLLLPSVIVEKEVELENGQRFTLELSLKLAESDRLEVLLAKLQRLEEIQRATEGEIVRQKGVLEGIMSALDIKDEPKRKKPGYHDRGCEYCLLF